MTQALMDPAKKTPSALVTTAVLCVVAWPSVRSLVKVAGFELWAAILSAGVVALVVRADQSEAHLAYKALQWLAVTVLCVDLLLHWMWVGMGVQVAMLTLAAVYPRLSSSQKKLLRTVVLVGLLALIVAQLVWRSWS